MPTIPGLRFAAGASACSAVATLGLLLPAAAGGAAAKAPVERTMEALGAGSVGGLMARATPRAVLGDASTAYVVFSNRSMTAGFARSVRRWISAHPGIDFVAVGYRMTPKAAAARARAAGWKLPVLSDRRGTVTRRMLVRSVPSLVTVGQDREVRILRAASGRREPVANPLTGRRTPVLPPVPSGAGPRTPAPADAPPPSAQDPDPEPTSRARPPAASPPAPTPPAAPKPPTGDRTGPSLSANWPASGTSLTSAREIVAGVSDPSGIAKVEQRVDGALRATELAAPYEFTLSPAGLSAGSHTFSLRAYDTLGNTTDASRAYTIPAPSTPPPSTPPPSTPPAPAPDTTGPSLSATWPAAGTTLTGPVAFSASASDPSGIARVQLRRAGALVATDQSAPYEFSLDPTGLAAGSHDYTLRAEDGAGNAAEIARTFSVAAPAPPSSGGPANPPLWSDSFASGWNKYGAGVDPNSRVSLLASGGQGDGGQALRITHPAGAYYGLGWYPRFGALGLTPMDDVHFRYYIKPWDQYYFRLEAKIPGLGGGNFPSGCDAPDPSKGWSGRLQWGQVDNHTKGRIQTYLYAGHPASNTGCGYKEFWQPGAELTPGNWACIEMRYKMNTPGQRDGVMQGWFNGQLKYERRDILFRSTTALKTDILAGVFYHGGTADWQPLKSEYVDFDSLAISDRYIGC